MKLRQGVAPGLLSLVFGPGFGLAAMGRWPRAFAWLAAILIGCIATAFWIWLFVIPVIAYFGASIDAFVVAARDDDYNLRSLRSALLIPILLVGIALVVRIMLLEAYRIPSSAMSPTLVVGDHVFVDKLTPRFASLPDRGEVIVFRMPCDPSREYVKRVVGLPGDTIEVRCSVLYVNGHAAPQTRLDTPCRYDESEDPGGESGSRPCTHYTEQLGGHTYETLSRADRAPTPSVGLNDFPRLLDIETIGCKYTTDIGSYPDERIPRIVTTLSTGGDCAPHAYAVVPDDTVFVMGDNRDNSNDSRYWGAVPLANIKGRVIGIWYPLSRFGSLP